MGAPRDFGVALNAQEGSQAWRGDDEIDGRVAARWAFGEDGDSGDTASTTQDSDNKDESLLNMANENGLKRSSSADLEDSLPPSKRPPGK